MRHNLYSRSALPPHSSPWTLAAYDASMVLEEEEGRGNPRRTLKRSTWSLMIACGGASGSQLASNVAGGRPLPMGPRLATYGGRRGSLAEGQGDVLGTTVDTWSASVPGACAVFFFSTRRRTRILRSSVLLSGVSASHVEWKSVYSRYFSCLPCFRTWNLDITLRAPCI